MLNAYTASDIRAAEQPLLDAGQGAALMRRAARGLAQAILDALDERGRRRYGARVVALAGSGNNGGDALYAAADLARRGLKPAAILTTDHAHDAALAAVRVAGGTVVTLVDESAALQLIVDADVLIDGIIGTGGRGGLREPVSSFVRQIGEGELRPDLVVACDIASGLDADGGYLEDARTNGIGEINDNDDAATVLRADLTVTFGGAKIGHIAGASPGGTGPTDPTSALVVVPIGIEDQLPEPRVRRLETSDVAALWPVPNRASQKYSRGVVGIVAGSAQYPGAAILSTAAAAATGVGMVRYLGPQHVCDAINLKTPEAVCSQDDPGKTHVQAWVLGPGTADTPDAENEQLDRCEAALAQAIEREIPAVVDAGAATRLPERGAAHLVLTPHAGELAALFAARGIDVERGAIEAGPLPHAQRAAALTGCTVLLKGSTTIIAGPDGTVFSQSEGTDWLSTAGSGDVLAGILGAILAGIAEHPEAFDAVGLGGSTRWAAAAVIAASIHGRAGRIAADDPDGHGPGRPIHASMIIEALPDTIGAVLRTAQN